MGKETKKIGCIIIIVTLWFGRFSILFFFFFFLGDGVEVRRVFAEGEV